MTRIKENNSVILESLEEDFFININELIGLKLLKNKQTIQGYTYNGIIFYTKSGHELFVEFEDVDTIKSVYNFVKHYIDNNQPRNN